MHMNMEKQYKNNKEKRLCKLREKQFQHNAQKPTNCLQRKQRERGVWRGRKGFKSAYRVSSSCNERPLNSESLIMSVLIIKRELLGTKQQKPQYQTSLQDTRIEERHSTVYFHDP